MSAAVYRRRVLVLPASGALLVSTDLHGNLEDFETLRERFLALRAREPATHWVLLGDLVHGPDAQAGVDQPDLYLFEDRSWEIVQAVGALRQRHPAHVHLVLGNHDHGHVGGPRPAKFYPDEVAHLEEQLEPEQRAALRALFAAARLVVLAPCGLVLAHGSPADEHFDLERIDRMPLEVNANPPKDRAVLRSLLTSYGQASEVTARLLAQASEQAGFQLHVVVHGHDRDDEGWFAEGGNQLCPVIFGAPRPHKRYLQVDLGARYTSVEALRDGVEIRRLYPEAQDG